jgi:hypothetical protein
MLETVMAPVAGSLVLLRTKRKLFGEMRRTGVTGMAEITVSVTDAVTEAANFEENVTVPE